MAQPATGIWYHCVVDWNPVSATLSVLVTERESGIVVAQAQISCSQHAFDAIDRLALSTVNDDYAPGATGEMRIDNVRVLQFPAAEWTPWATSGPSRRVYFAMAHDQARGETVLFGGGQSTVPNNPNYSPDTWAWNEGLGVRRCGHPRELGDRLRGAIALPSGRDGWPGQ